MKYRHSFHAGNFADVHKHVTLLALHRRPAEEGQGLPVPRDPRRARRLRPLHPHRRCGRRHRPLSPKCAPEAPELRAYAQQLAQVRTWLKHRAPLPGLARSWPLSALRPQDRAVLIELQGSEVNALGEP